VKNKFTFLILFISFSLLTCKKEKESYPYRKNLDTFLKNTFDLKIPEEETTLIFLPLDGCHTCLENTIQLLIDHASHDINLYIIVSSRNKNAFTKFNLNQINIPSDHFFFDRNNDYERYEIGVSVPIILHFKDDEIVFFSETFQSNHNDIKSHFNCN